MNAVLTLSSSSLSGIKYSIRCVLHGASWTTFPVNKDCIQADETHSECKEK